MSEEINHDRRSFLGIVAMIIAASKFGVIGSANAQSGKITPAVDRDAVKFLARCAANGMELGHCPPYIREWIVREGV